MKWYLSQLDSGHWIAECGNISSPIHHSKIWVKSWIKTYMKRFKKGEVFSVTG